jgi:hypothetical protein
MTLADLRKFALLIAPELGQAPLYILDLPESYPRPAGCDAFATHVLDFSLRDELLRRGEWTGPGAAIVFCRPAPSAADALALTVHEVGHLVPHVAPPVDREPSLDELVAERQLLTRLAEPDTGPPILAPWGLVHGLDFIRAALHLADRGWRRGYTFPGHSLAAGEPYGLSPLAAYAIALADEPYRLAGATFAEIEAIEPPAAFSALWAKDTQPFFRKG